MSKNISYVDVGESFKPCSSCGSNKWAYRQGDVGVTDPLEIVDEKERFVCKQCGKSLSQVDKIADYKKNAMLRAIRG